MKQPDFSRINRNYVWCALLALIVFIVFKDFFLSGYVIDGQYDRRNNLLPYYYIFSRAFHSFVIPQWNPYLFCGNSLFANSTYTFFYPPNFLIWALPEQYIPLAATALATVHFFLAGLFCYKLIHEVVEDSYWSFAGAAAYLLSSASIMSIFSCTEQFLVFVYSPLILYLIHTSARRSPLTGFVLQAAANALLLLGGQLQFIIYATGIHLCYALYQAVTSRPRHGRLTPLLVAGGSIGFAAMIAAIRYIPFFQSVSSNSFSKTSYERLLEVYGAHPANLITLFMPEFFTYVNRGETFNVYAGAVTALLACFAVFFVRGRSSLFWKLLIVLITLVVMKTPLTYFYFLVTGKANLSFGKLSLFIPLPLAVTAAVAGKAICSDEVMLRAFRFFAAVMSCLVLATGIAFYLRAPIPYPPDWDPARIVHWIRFSLVFFAVIATLMLRATFLAGREQRLLFKSAVALLLCADLFYFARYYANFQNPAFVKEPFFVHDQREADVRAQFDARRDFRVLGFSEGTSYNRSITGGLYSSSGYESMVPYHILILYPYPNTLPRDSARHISPNSLRLLQLTSTRFVFQEGTGGLAVPQALPRYSLYDAYLTVPDDRDALELMHGMRTGFEPGRQIILDTRPELEIRAGEGTGKVELLEEGLNRIDFEVSTPRNSLLLLNDTFDTGWSAAIDGRSTPVMRANYAFRAVSVPEGRHHVRFSFEASGLQRAKTVSIVALACFLAMAAVVMARERMFSRNS